MRFEWDEAKRRRNMEKHGVDLAELALMDRRTIRQTVDDRRDYGELRVLLYGEIGGRLHAAVVAPRGDVIRVISLRRANSREVRNYERS